MLVYLYTPFNLDASNYLASRSIASSEASVSSEVLVSDDVSHDWVSARRIRLTHLLLRYQKQIADLESLKDPLSTEAQTELESLRNKVKNLEQTITELAQ